MVTSHLTCVSIIGANQNESFRNNNFSLSSQGFSGLTGAKGEVGAAGSKVRIRSLFLFSYMLVWFCTPVWWNLILVINEAIVNSNQI